MSIAVLATAWFVVQLLVGAILVIGEATGSLRLPYGKFRMGAGISFSARNPARRAHAGYVLRRSGRLLWWPATRRG